MRKAFEFKLLNFDLRKSFLLLASCFLLLPSCQFNPSYQGKGTVYLQGEWKQDSVISEKRLINYALYHFTFSCDSFFVRMENFSTINYGADTCMKGGHWFEYTKGDYEMRKDTLHLKGFYANANNTLKDPGGCFNSGVYEEYFKVAKQGDSVLNMQPLGNTLPIKVKLVKRLSCVPKPL